MSDDCGVGFSTENITISPEISPSESEDAESADTLSQMNTMNHFNSWILAASTILAMLCGNRLSAAEAVWINQNGVTITNIWGQTNWAVDHVMGVRFMKSTDKTTIEPDILYVFSDSNPSQQASNHVAAMTRDGTLKLVLDMLVKSGEFCRIRGHSWGQHMHVTLEYVPNRIGCRECKVCGMHQE